MVDKSLEQIKTLNCFPIKQPYTLILLSESVSILSISWRRRWRSSERIALRVLEELGYKVIETGKKIVIDGITISEVDAVAVDNDGNCYAVEVKAGSIDVTGIRQAYTNAQLVNCKPLIIGKGFSDEAAEKLAEKLGVKAYQLSDVFLVDAEELELIIRSSIESLVGDLLEAFISSEKLTSNDSRLLEKIAKSRSISELADSFGVSIKEAVKMINNLRERGVIPQRLRDYRSIRLYALLRLLGWKLRLMNNE